MFQCFLSICLCYFLFSFSLFSPLSCCLMGLLFDILSALHWTHFCTFGDYVFNDEPSPSPPVPPIPLVFLVLLSDEKGGGGEGCNGDDYLEVLVVASLSMLCRPRCWEGRDPQRHRGSKALMRLDIAVNWAYWTMTDSVSSFSPL